ncbi:MAG: hypothetical protein RLN76_13135 [Phycisphaeraceae bacterium]
MPKTSYNSITLHSSPNPTLISLILSALCLLLATTPAPAQTLVSNNSTFTVDPTRQDMAYSWIVDGREQLREISNWYRVSGQTNETSVHTMLFGGASQSGPDSVSYAFTNTQFNFNIDITFTVIGGALLSGYSQMGEEVLITNNGSTPLNIHFFEYVDLDLDESPSNDTLDAPIVGTILQYDPVTTYTGGYSADRIEFATYPFSLNHLTDFAPSTLNTNLPVLPVTLGPDNVTFTLQWDFIGAGGIRPAILPGESARITKTSELQWIIPEPASGLLTPLALFALTHRKR